MAQVITSQPMKLSNLDKNVKFTLKCSEQFGIQAILDTINQLS